MIIWNDKMLVTDEAKKNLKKIKNKIEKPDKLRFGAYLITLSSNGTDLFDIYNMQFFPVKHFKEKGYDADIIGVAESKEAAEKLAGSICLTFGNRFGKVSREDIIKYFKEV